MCLIRNAEIRRLLTMKWLINAFHRCFLTFSLSSISGIDAIPKDNQNGVKRSRWRYLHFQQESIYHVLITPCVDRPLIFMRSMDLNCNISHKRQHRGPKKLVCIFLVALRLATVTITKSERKKGDQHK